jgi:hypothetical protein
MGLSKCEEIGNQSQLCMSTLPMPVIDTADLVPSVFVLTLDSACRRSQWPCRPARLFPNWTGSDRLPDRLASCSVSSADMLVPNCRLPACYTPIMAHGSQAHVGLRVAWRGVLSSASIPITKALADDSHDLVTALRYANTRTHGSNSPLPRRRLVVSSSSVISLRAMCPIIEPHCD